jgi:pimeloyl-ACP methyl ester carboxylesterase
VSERIVVGVGGSELVGEQWSGGSPMVVLLHAGVTDRRSWRGVAEVLAPTTTVVAYDRRGHGQSAPSSGPFSHVDDLIAVLDEVAVGRVWLVGNSMGGGLALDAVLSVPDRVAGLVLLAPAVSGAPEHDFGSDPETRFFEESITRALERGDHDDVNRLETWLWLDGPAGPEGRIGGDARRLALEMNAVILGHDTAEEVGGSGVDAWDRLDEVLVPTTVACGDRDVSFLVARSGELAQRLPRGRHRLLEGMAHLPSLEQPAAVAALVREALTTG